MNPDRSTETRISDWLLEEAPAELPDRVLRATFERTRATRQRWSLRGWRPLRVFRLSPTAITVSAAAIAVVAVGLALFPRSNQSIGVVPSPFVSASPSPEPSGPGSRFGITMDSPASWTVSHDSIDWFYLAAPSGESSLQGVFLFRDPLVPIVNPQCTETADPARPHAVNDFVNLLAGSPGLVSSEPVPVTIGGLSGFSLDIALEPSGANSETCVSYAIQASTPPEYFWALSFGEVQRVAFLDAGDGHVIAVVINARGQIKFDLLTRDVALILESLTFNDIPKPN